ncbi:MerR family transcriptional regulator [Streptomyces europaeiscabiei]|uniref:MerR family transcriptional regulator n=1 Tax=Streptomyces europaeiscabiei TaxID=146819 RepID=UPI000765B44B|nr:MerR family transcriptional regulator [Streptomyces europaeiscabiei]MDX3779341.1 MerR family transcriptional regulator [Streptomyces europaeiscabiei]MDX3832264.1 MerR family transcriptional regulator [Streptomyces europaeiscabiei]MDX3840597.1 MerR family transcriptional regulator [Streptomyces europaeiscabiei]
MGMLTIGAFAKACRLSPKALRLYDELELLRPARVDPDTGYRYYATEQLEQARLVAWLRRLGMPLARIRTVCALAPGPAAREIRAYWAGVEAETATRRDLAAFLVDHLTQPSEEDITMLELRYAAVSDTGLVRATNQDTAYAGTRVLAVADGFGPAGAPASAAAVEALKTLDRDTLPAGSVLNLLDDAVRGATAAVRDIAGTGDDGTTLTAMLWTGSQLALVHIGDSRAYLLRDGELFRITHDHTVVQSMIDEGRLTPEEATTHPQPALLLKALTNNEAISTPDLRLHDAQPGDRYLLCSDGLSTVVPDPAVQRVLSAAPNPQAAVHALVTEANEAGGPDNVSCVVADVVRKEAA